jgi:preprotein translocase subunit SecE
MAKQAVATEAKPSIVQKIVDYFQEVRVELGKVTWPTLNDLKVSTKVTLWMLLIMSMVTFGFDQIFHFIVYVWLNLFA